MAAFPSLKSPQWKRQVQKKDADTPDSNESKIVTTEEELEAYFIIKNLLKDVVDLQDITYKDTESYINILYKKNTRKWICRLKLTDTVKTLIVPDEEKRAKKFNLTSVQSGTIQRSAAQNIGSLYVIPA